MIVESSHFIGEEAKDLETMEVTQWVTVNPIFIGSCLRRWVDSRN